MSEWPARIFDVSIGGTKALLTEQPFSAPAPRVTGTQQRPVLPFRPPGTGSGKLETGADNYSGVVAEGGRARFSKQHSPAVMLASELEAHETRTPRRVE